MESAKQSLTVVKEYQTAQIKIICVNCCIFCVLFLKPVSVVSVLFDESNGSNYEELKSKEGHTGNFKVYQDYSHCIVRHLNCGGEFSGLDRFLFI